MFQHLGIRQASAIHRSSETLSSKPDSALQQSYCEIRRRVLAGEPVGRVLPLCYALTMEASHRLLGKRHFPVQVLAGRHLLSNGMTEMATGEGKTITALLPSILRAFEGRGVHVVTSNSYLSKRDADELRPVYEFAGLTVGCLEDAADHEQKRKEYDADVTYGTGSQFAFDFLRDRIVLGPGSVPATESRSRPEGVLQRGRYFALIDEADVILIDDAATPLIIGEEEDVPSGEESLVEWAHSVQAVLTPIVDFYVDEPARRSWLTPAGHDRVSIQPLPDAICAYSLEELLNRVEKAIVANHIYKKGRDYLVVDGQVVLIGEGSGRVLHGRKWQDGLHQAVEAKEAVEFGSESSTAARTTVQQYFGLYERLSGMTGTARPIRSEVRRYFQLRVRCIPTNRPCVRSNLGVRAFLTLEDKHNAVAQRASKLTEDGRAVLIGVPSVSESSQLKECLVRRGVDCELLNAENDEQESAIIARAGTSGQVTIATNMAGRGTDILLDDECRQAGGLHVILTQCHNNRRFDRQLIGRAARQGDPGSFEYLLSFEDEILTRHAPEVVRIAQTSAVPDDNGEVDQQWAKWFFRTQRSLERRDRTARKESFRAEQEMQRRIRRSGIDPYLEVLT